MPALSERVNLAECASHGRPADFTNASPIGKKILGKQAKGWTIAISLLSVIAVGAIGYFVWTVFFNQPPVS